MERSFLDKHDYWSYAILVVTAVGGPLLVRDWLSSSFAGILASGFFGIIGFGIAFFVYKKPVTYKIAAVALALLLLVGLGFFTRN